MALSAFPAATARHERDREGMLMCKAETPGKRGLHSHLLLPPELRTAPNTPVAPCWHVAVPTPGQQDAVMSPGAPFSVCSSASQPPRHHLLWDFRANQREGGRCWLRAGIWGQTPGLGRTPSPHFFPLHPQPRGPAPSFPSSSCVCHEFNQQRTPGGEKKQSPKPLALQRQTQPLFLSFSFQVELLKPGQTRPGCWCWPCRAAGLPGPLTRITLTKQPRAGRKQGWDVGCVVLTTLLPAPAARIRANAGTRH